MTRNKPADCCLHSVSKETKENRNHVSLAKHPTIETLWGKTASSEVYFFLVADGLWPGEK